MPTLRSLIDERLSPGRRDEIESHVETCLLCEQTLEEMTREDTPWLAALKLDPGWGPVGTSGERFRLVRRIDGGGQGDIYIARDEELQRDVALKRIKDEYSDDWSRKAVLIREALITGSLDHPGIVPVYALGQDAGGHSYYAMRLVRSIVDGGEGRNTLEQAIADFHAGLPRWNLRGLLERFLAVCHTIQYAHDQGVLHCDLKPLNIVLGPYGETLVLDWGAARSFADTQRAMGEPRIHADNGCLSTQEAEGPTWTGPRFVTVAYASPEQLDARLGEISRASDVYSLGGILRCILTGYSPRKAAEATTTEAPGVWNGILRRRRAERRFPEALAAVCSKALSERPEDRYASARALADEVGRWLADEPVSVHREGLIDRMTRLCRRYRAWTVAGAASLLLVTIVSMASAWTINQARGRAVDLSSELAHDRGQSLCEQGDVSRGALWLARGLEIAEGNDGESRRMSLAAWGRRLCPLDSYFLLPDGLMAIASDPSGRFMIARDKEWNAQLWDVAKRKRIGPEILHRDLMTSAFSPDGSRLLTSGEDKVSRIWDTSMGQPIGDPIRHQGNVRKSEFSADGSIVLTGSEDGLAQAWEVRTGKALGAPVRHERAVYAIAFGKDGKIAISGGADGKLRLWEPRTGKPIGQPLDHAGRTSIIAVALSPDGRTALTGSGDRRARLWRIPSGALVKESDDFEYKVGFVEFSADGTIAVAGSQNGNIRCFDVETGSPVGRPIRLRDYLFAMKLSPDGRTLLTACRDMTARLWDVATGEPIAAPMVHQGEVELVGFDPDGGSVFTGSADGGVRVWRMPERGRVTGILEPSLITMNLRSEQARKPGSRGDDDADRVMACQLDSAGRVVLTATFGGKVQLWDVATGQPLGRAIREIPDLKSAALSPDATRALTTGREPNAKVWDTLTGQLLHVLECGDQVTTVSFLPTLAGHAAITGGWDGKAKIWNADTGEMIALLQDAGPSSSSPVIAVAASPDGRTVLTGSSDGSVRRWDARTGKLLGPRLALSRSAAVIVFSPDCRLALVGTDDSRSAFFDLRTGKQVGSPLQHPKAINVAAFRRDGRAVITGCDSPTGSEGILQYWQAEIGKPIGPPTVQPGGIWSLVFGADGRTVITGSKDGIARRREFLRAIEGDSDRISRSIETMTGLELDEAGTIRPLEPREWEARKSRLQGQGGPPSPL
jgi:WD40 repeat protein/serine/threonine protein kinase